MADGSGAEDAEASAERAFEDLRAEVSVLRRAIEALPAAWQAARPSPPPDYGADLARVVKALAGVADRLQAIEAKPALQETPESFGARVANAGQSAIRRAEQGLQAATAEARQTGRALADMIGHKRGQKEQRADLLWVGICTALAVFLLTFVGAPDIYRQLPFGWNQVMATAAMNGQGDRWTAGADLMMAANPQGWNQLLGARDLVLSDKANAKAVAACRAEAAKTHRPQACRITVKAPK